MKIVKSRIIGIQTNKFEQILLKGIKNWFKVGEEIDRDEIWNNYKEKKLVSFDVQENEIQEMIEEEDEDGEPGSSLTI